MNVQEIAAEGSRIAEMDRDHERWDAERELIKAKAACPDYRSSEQSITFAEWMKQLIEASKSKGVEWGSDEIRADYYDNQPEVWVSYYDDGCSADDAIDSDMECWDS